MIKSMTVEEYRREHSEYHPEDLAGHDPYNFCGKRIRERFFESPPRPDDITLEIRMCGEELITVGRKKPFNWFQRFIMKHLLDWEVYWYDD